MAIVGDPIDSGVITQLLKRQEIFSKSNRTENDIKYLSSKSSWIRLVSGVDNLTSSQQSQFSDDTPFVIEQYSSSKAKEFVLSGGVLKWNSRLQKFIKSEGINFTPSEDSYKTYNFNDRLGIRPEPGLTSFKIQSKNRFGTIRQAEINFNVWSREDLDLAEAMFFRPGFPVIVEWGNSMYVDNNGEIKTTLPSKNFSSFFNQKYFDEIIEILNKNKEYYNYNYDAFIGLITNFSFSFRQDGGYDCTLTVVSHGTVLDSLSFKKSSKYKNTNLTEENSDSNKSALHFILNEISNTLLPSNNKKLILEDGIAGIDDLKNEEIKNDIINQFPNEPKYFNIIGPPANAGRTAGFGVDFDSSYRIPTLGYISFRSFLSILNTAISTNQEFGRAIQLREGESFSLDYGEKYNTFKNHFSLDPGVAFLPKKVEQSGLNVGMEFVTYKGEQILTSDLQKIAISNEASDNEILEIRLSLPFIRESLDQFFDSTESPESLNCSDFLKSFLSKLNETLGGINDFDFEFDNDSLKFKIVDRNLNPFTGKEKRPLPPSLDLVGLKSLVTELSVQSKISSQLASAISISAEGSSSSTEKKEYLMSWNRNYKKRFKFRPYTELITTPATINSESSTKRTLSQILLSAGKAVPLLRDIINSFENKKLLQEDENSFILKISNYYKDLTKPDRGYPFKYSKTLFTDLLAEGIEKTKEAAKTINAYNGQPNGGLIPVDLAFTIEGIGGLKIGQAFKLPKNTILPSHYNGYGFIITGLNHKIDNNKWYTEITAITIKIEEELKQISTFISSKELLKDSIKVKPGEY